MYWSYSIVSLVYTYEEEDTCHMRRRIHVLVLQYRVSCVCMFVCVYMYPPPHMMYWLQYRVSSVCIFVCVCARSVCVQARGDVTRGHVSRV